MRQSIDQNRIDDSKTGNFSIFRMEQHRFDRTPRTIAIPTNSNLSFVHSFRYLTPQFSQTELHGRLNKETNSKTEPFKTISLQ